LEVSSNGQTILVNRGWIPRVFLSTDNQGLYDRPRGPVSVVAVRTKAETPRFLVPEHDAKHRRLFWMDLDTMKAWTNDASPSSSPPISLYIQVKPKDDDGEGLTRKEIVKYPAPPSASSVGEFVTTPAIHVGYAATWFGLAGAGVVMTRKLITRGRG
jgi:cytochrome oxidase assembly protein ShyY1